MSRKNRYSQTIHHVVPSSRRSEGFLTEMPANKKLLRKNYHANWHTLLANKLPSEVIHAVTMVQHNVIRKEVRRIIEALCHLPLKDFYVPEVLDDYADDCLEDLDIGKLRDELKIRVNDLLRLFDSSDDSPS